MSNHADPDPKQRVFCIQILFLNWQAWFQVCQQSPTKRQAQRIETENEAGNNKERGTGNNKEPGNKKEPGNNM